MFTGTQDSTSWYSAGQAYGADSIAYELFENERPEFFPWRQQEQGNSVQFRTIRLGTRTQLNFKFAFTPTLSMTQSLEDKNVTTEDVPYAQAPESFRKKVEEALVNLRKQYKDMKPEQFSGGNPKQGNTIPPRL